MPKNLTIEGTVFPLESYETIQAPELLPIIEALVAAIPTILSGTATLVAGTVTVSTTGVLADDKILVCHNTPGGTVGIASVPVASIVTGTSFVINSSDAGDTSTVNWLIVR